jgi:hypothetical protein
LEGDRVRQDKSTDTGGAVSICLHIFFLTFRQCRPSTRRCRNRAKPAGICGSGATISNFLSEGAYEPSKGAFDLLSSGAPAFCGMQRSGASSPLPVCLAPNVGRSVAVQAIRKPPSPKLICYAAPWLNTVSGLLCPPIINSFAAGIGTVRLG